MKRSDSEMFADERRKLKEQFPFADFNLPDNIASVCRALIDEAFCDVCSSDKIRFDAIIQGGFFAKYVSRNNPWALIFATEFVKYSADWGADIFIRNKSVSQDDLSFLTTTKNWEPVGEDFFGNQTYKRVLDSCGTICYVHCGDSSQNADNDLVEFDYLLCKIRYEYNADLVHISEVLNAPSRDHVVLPFNPRTSERWLKQMLKGFDTYFCQNSIAYKTLERKFFK